MKKYDLDFMQAFELVVNGGAVKGDGFRDGIFLKLNSYGQLVTVDACHTYKETEKVFISSLSHQKYRIVKIWTVK